MRKGRLGFLSLCFAYLILVLTCAGSLIANDELSLGRRPIFNLVKTAKEMARPSFLDVWSGNPHFEYRNEEGQVLRVEDRREVERTFLGALKDAIWATLKIATLGSLLGSVLALPFGLAVAKNLRAPVYLSVPAKVILDASRSIHTLVFGLFYVGIIGLGPTAGILAIASHCLGTFGKLYAESIETLDMAAVEGVRAVGASPAQVFFLGVWPLVIPQFVSINLYVWEYNIRDSTVLGLVGAGGLGLLISDSVSLFQWARLSTILLATVALVSLFDAASRRVRQALL